MNQFTNFKTYTPEVLDMPELNIGYLISDEGVDWYECQQHFAAKSLKVAFDASRVIRSMSHDVSMLWPHGLSVAEVNDADAPDGVDVSGGWVFENGMIAAREYTAEELQAQARDKKQRLIADATKAISPLQDAVDLDMATDDEKADLLAWKQYRVKVNRIDVLAAPEIDWPEVPQNVA